MKLISIIKWNNTKVVINPKNITSIQTEIYFNGCYWFYYLVIDGVNIELNRVDNDLCNIEQAKDNANRNLEHRYAEIIEQMNRNIYE